MKLSTHPASSLSRRHGLRLAPSCRPSHLSTSLLCPQHIGSHFRSLPSSPRLLPQRCMAPSVAGLYTHEARLAPETGRGGSRCLGGKTGLGQPAHVGLEPVSGDGTS